MSRRRRTLLVAVAVLAPLVFWAATIPSLTDIPAVSGDDTVWMWDISAAGAVKDREATVDQVGTYLNSAATTLTNKTLDGDDNTVQDLGGVSLKTGGTTSSQLRAALTDETGTGTAVFSASPTLTGAVGLPNGSAGTGTGSIYFTNDADCGLFLDTLTGSDTWGFFAGGTNIFQIREQTTTTHLGFSAAPWARVKSTGEIYLAGQNNAGAHYGIRLGNAANHYYVRNAAGSDVFRVGDDGTALFQALSDIDGPGNNFSLSSTGDLTIAGDAAIGHTTPDNNRLLVRGATNDAAEFAFTVENSDGNAMIDFRNDLKIFTYTNIFLAGDTAIESDSSSAKLHMDTGGGASGTVTLSSSGGTAGNIILDSTAATTGDVTVKAKGSIDIGNNTADTVTIDTDGTGDGELVLPTDSVSGGEILDGTIADADVSPSAAIARSKLADGVRTEFVPVGWLEDGTVPPGALVTFSDTRKVDIRKFAGDATEDVEGYWTLPEDATDAVAGGDWQLKIRVKFIITETTEPAAGEGVSWDIQAVALASGEDIGAAALGTLAELDDADLDAHVVNDVVYSPWVEMTLTGAAAGESVFFNLARDHDDTVDDYAQDVGLIGLEFKFTCASATY